ncbi:19252_t:CDS:1, partial [Dentiscutata erythropus]
YRFYSAALNQVEVWCLIFPWQRLYFPIESGLIIIKWESEE